MPFKLIPTDPTRPPGPNGTKHTEWAQPNAKGSESNNGWAQAVRAASGPAVGVPGDALARSTGPLSDGGALSLLPPTGAPLPDWISPWDTITLAGLRLPGIARVEGGRRHRYDHKTTLGAVGEAATFLGVDPGEITITLTLWIASQWAELQDILPRILPPPSPKMQPRAVDVVHGPLNVLNIDQIYLVGCMVPQVTSPGGPVEVKINAWEYLPQVALVPDPPLADDPRGPLTGAILDRRVITRPSAGAGVVP